MKLLKTKEVSQILNVSIDTFRKKVKHQPSFPKPVILSPKAHPQWRDEDVANYFNRNVA